MGNENSTRCRVAKGSCIWARASSIASAPHTRSQPPPSRFLQVAGTQHRHTRRHVVPMGCGKSSVTRRTYGRSKTLCLPFPHSCPSQTRIFPLFTDHLNYRALHPHGFGFGAEVYPSSFSRDSELHIRNLNGPPPRGSPTTTPRGSGMTMPRPVCPPSPFHITVGSPLPCPKVEQHK